MVYMYDPLQSKDIEDDKDPCINWRRFEGPFYLGYETI